MTGFFAALGIVFLIIFIACIMVAGTAIIVAPFLAFIAWIIRLTRPG